MKGKSLLAACLIVPSAVFALAIYLYANQAKLDIDRYGFFRTVDHSLVLQFGQHLVWLDKQGREKKSYDLGQLGVTAEGDYDFFRNGEVLVYNRQVEPGMLHALARLLRLQKHALSPSEAADGLYRCDLQTNGCKRFAAQLPALDSSFRLAIDRQDDTVYLADTPAFKLYKLSPSGETLAASGTETFKFPNQLVLTGEELWLADTNHHRLVSVSTHSNSFAEVGESFAAELEGEYRWPHQIAYDGEGWWVNIADNGMANGRIVHFSRSGERGISIDLPGTADPLGLAYWQRSLWVADFAEPVLERYAPDGSALPAAISPTLDQVSAQSRSDYAYYQSLGYVGLAGFLLVMSGGFAAAWRLEKQQTIAQFKQLANSSLDELVARPAKQASASQIYWLVNRMQQKKRLLIMVFTIFLAGALGSLAVMFKSGEEIPAPLLQLMAAMFIFVVVFVVTLAWLMQRICQQKLGVIGASVVLHESESKRSVARAEQIVYTSTHLMADGVIVNLGRPQQRWFDRKELEDYIYPRLKGAQKLGHLAMLKHLWRAREPQLVASLIIVFLSLALYLCVEFGLPR